MNANELADYMDYLADDLRCEGFDDKEPRLVATMLRQLQAENQELRAKLGCDPAYFDMPARKLTDEEIEELAMEYLENTGKGIVGVYDFVRAILRKAQEK